MWHVMKAITKTSTLRARCTPSEKELVRRQAQEIGLDESDIVRLALRAWFRRRAKIAA